MLEARELTTEFEYREYIRNYYHFFDSTLLELSIEYLEKAHVVGIYNLENKMVAGYTLNTYPDFRLVKLVPNPMDIIPPDEAFSWDKCCEIVCIWKNAELVPRTYTLKVMWAEILRKFLATKKEYALGFSQHEKIDKFYSAFGTSSLYKGTGLKGVDSHLFTLPEKNAQRAYSFFSQL